MNHYGPVRAFWPHEDDLIRSAHRQSLNAVAAHLCRDPVAVRHRGYVLARRAKQELRRQRGFRLVTSLVVPAAELRT